MAVFNFDSTFLLSGRNYTLDEHITLKHPKLIDIFNLGENCDRLYASMVNIVASNPFENKAMLWNIGIDYEKVDEFQVFCNMFHYTCEACKDTSINNLYALALSFFIGKEDSFFCLTENDGEFLLYDVNHPEIVIDKNKFSIINSFYRTLNFMSNEEPPKFSSEAFKREFIEDEIEEMKFKSNDNNDKYMLNNIISAVVFGGEGSVSFSNMENLSIYQLYNAYMKLRKKAEYNTLMSAYYEGNIKLSSSEKDQLCWWT